MKWLYTFTLMTAFSGLCGAVHAQERTASGALDTQVNWNALKNIVNGANAKSDAVNTRVDQIVTCNKLMKLYAPGAENADGQGCIDLPFVKETEYVESAGWVSSPYTLACTKGRKISYAMLNVSTKSNQLACGRSGANCDGNATASLLGKTSWSIVPDSGKVVSAFIECK